MIVACQLNGRGASSVPCVVVEAPRKLAADSFFGHILDTGLARPELSEPVSNGMRKADLDATTWATLSASWPQALTVEAAG